MSESNSNIPLAQMAQQEVEEQVQNVNAHLYDRPQGDIQALGRDQFINMMANMQAQMLPMQQQMRQYQEGLQYVPKYQQEVDQQADEILATLQQQLAEEVATIPPPPVQISQVAKPVPPAPPVLLPIQPIVSNSLLRVDSAKIPAPFKGKRAEDIES